MSATNAWRADLFLAQSPRPLFNLGIDPGPSMYARFSEIGFPSACQRNKFDRWGGQVDGAEGDPFRGINCTTCLMTSMGSNG